MKEKEYAVVALKDILCRALGAVEQGAILSYTDACDAPRGWDLEFVQMSREEQAGWLLRLFEVLVEHG